MKRISLILLFLSFALLAQSKTFLPLQLTSSNGRPLNDYTVKLKQSGSTVATLTYLDNSAGWYYWTGGTSTVPWGDYDIYITISGADKLWRSGVSIRNGYTISQVARDTVSAVMVDSLPDLLPRATQYKDTLQLKAATSDSFGFVVNLKQLSSANTNGGGSFVLRSTSDYTADGIVAYSSATAGRVWVRQEYIDGNYIDARWAGVTPNDDTDDDGPAILRAYTANQTLNANRVVLPDGDIDFNGPLHLDQKTGLFTYANRLQGAGYGRTFLYTKNDTTAFKVRTSSGNFMNRVEFYDMSIIGPGEGVAGDSTCGIDAYKSTQMTISRCQIEDWRFGVHGYRIEGSIFEHSRIIGNYVNIKFRLNANGNKIDHCSVGQATLYAFWQNGGSGTVWEAGEGGNCEVQWKLEGCNFTIIGGNFESIDDTYFDINNANVIVSGTRFITTGNDTVTLAELTNNGSNLTLIAPIVGVGREDSLVIVDNASIDVRYYGQKYNTSIGGHNTTYGHFPINSSITRPFDQTGDPRASAIFQEYRGSFKFIYREQGTTDIDKLLFTRQMNDTTFYDVSMFDGTQWEFSTNGAAWARQDRILHAAGRKTLSTTAGDSTVSFVLIPKPENTSTAIYSINHSVQQASGYNFGSVYTGITSAAAADTLHFITWHPNNTGGTLPFLLHVNLKYKIAADTYDD